MTCPLCLAQFALPRSGLPRNVYIDTILRAQRGAPAPAAAAAAGSVDSGRRSCTSVVQSLSNDRDDDWPAPTPSAAERGTPCPRKRPPFIF